MEQMMAALDIEQPELLRNNVYMEFLLRYDEYYYKKWFGKQGLSFEKGNFAKYRVQFQAQHYKNNNVKYAIMAYTNGYNFSDNPEYYAANLRQIEKIFPNGKYNAKMRQLELAMSGLKSGMKAPPFTLKDLTGKMVHLSDFEGKVVYLDFWASWCLPCIIENQSIKKLKPKYEDKDVVFLYITKDKNDSAWVEAIRKQGIEGVHLMGGGDKIFDEYQADGVLHYVLIDKKGHIITSNAPRPSDRANLEAMIDKALID